MPRQRRNMRPDELGERTTLKNIEKLLNFLNSKPDTFAPESDLRKQLGVDYGNTLTEAQGYTAPSISNAEYNALSAYEKGIYAGALAQARQTQYVEHWTNLKTQETGYKLTLRGAEALNSMKGVRSSRNLEKLTGVLFVITLVLLTTNLPVMLAAWNGLGTWTKLLLFVVIIILLIVIYKVAKALLKITGTFGDPD